MTLIDVDGTLPPPSWRSRRRAAAARAIRRLGIGGSIGIDLPTVAGKERRPAVGAGVDRFLPAAVRTHRDQRLWLRPDRPPARAGLAARARGRPGRFRGARAAAPGGDRADRRARWSPIRRWSPSSKRIPDWIEALARQVGGAVTLRTDASLPSMAAMPRSLKQSPARCAGSRRRRARAFLQPRMQGPRPAEMARRRLSDSGSEGRSPGVDSEEGDG